MIDENSDKLSGMDRRDFIRNLSATGALGAFGATTITRAQARQAAETVDTLTGYDRRRQLQRARETAEVRELLTEFEAEGKRPNYDGATVYRSIDEHNDLTYHTVVIPMRVSSGGGSTAWVEQGVKRRQSLLLWTDHDELDAVGHDFAYVGDNEWKNRVYKKNDGQLRVTEGSANLRQVQKEANRRAGAGSPQIQALGCPDLDWQCVMGMASSFAFMFFNCGKCVVSGFADAAGCFFCVTNVIGAAASICDPCPPDDDWPFGSDDGPTACPGGTFESGQDVVATEPVNVRTEPKIAKNVTFTQPSGTGGTIGTESGCIQNDGFTWWRVDWDNGKVGWSPQEKLNRD